MNDLVNLIDSMSMSEKRYFKMNFRDSKASALFDHIVNRASSKDDLNALNKKYYPRLQSYLYNSILRELRQFHDERSNNRKLDNLIHEIDILAQRGLMPEAKRRLNLAKKLANQLNDSTKQLWLTIFESNLIKFYTAKEYLKLKPLNDRSLKEHLGLVKFEEETRLIMQELTDKWRKDYRANATKQLEALRSKAPNEKFAHNSFYYNYSYFLNNHIKYSERGEFEKVEELANNALNIFITESQKSSDSFCDALNKKRYNAILSFHLAALRLTSETDLFFSYVEKLEQEVDLGDGLMFGAYYAITSHSISNNIPKRAFDFFQKRDLQRFLKLHEENFRTEAFLLNYAYILFMLQDYSSAQHYLSKVTYLIKPKLFTIYYTALLMAVIVNLELKNIDHASNSLDRAKRIFQSNKNIKKYTAPIANFLSAVISKNTYNLELAKEFGKLRLTKPYHKNSELDLNEFFDFEAWMKDKCI